MAVQLLDENTTREIKDSELPIPDGDPETVYTIRDLTKKTYREVIKRNTKKVTSRQRGMVDETDFQKVADELLDHALVEWRGVTLNGSPVPCTWENKARLDSVRSSAILDAAGIGQVEEAPAQKKASFREPASVA
jgi:hypothetical protein